jgi:hypothetical protein
MIDVKLTIRLEQAGYFSQGLRISCEEAEGFDRALGPGRRGGGVAWETQNVV